MPKFNVDKSIVINVSPAQAYAKLRDFNNWTPWSPWIITEPSTKVNVGNDGKFYEWEGDITGSGNMTIVNEKENEAIDIDLLFLKPWKSKSKVSFLFKPEGDGTRVHWTMEGSLPFFMFWMKKMMSVFIGMDYERGLSMLKEFIEEGKVYSELEIKGISNYEGCQYVGIKRSGSISDIGGAMKEDYEKLMPYFMQNHKDKVAGHPFSIYHKWDPVKDHVEYTAAMPVSSVPGDLLDGMFVGNVPQTKVHTVKHTGPYIHVGNAWSAQVNRERAKKFKQNKSIPPMEVYLNSPTDTPERELQSEIVFSVKG